ncbi:MAG: hypothetical protein K8R60_24110 [Burkholderiales bacterium]|nr:hypothetical protein [Burkholderiales bacterium]
MARTNCAAWLAATMVACALTGCGGGGGGADAGVRATIGAAGGTLVSADGAFTLTIPAGALGNPTDIVITELKGNDIPAPLRLSTLEKAYRLEPAGTRFAVTARAKVTLPLGAPDDLVALALDSAGTGSIELAAGQSIDERVDGLVLEADVAHFSYAIINRFPGVASTLTAVPPSVMVGETVRIEMVVFGTTTENLSLTTSETGGADYGGLLNAFEVVAFTELPEHEFTRGVPSEARGTLTLKCLKPFDGGMGWSYKVYNMFIDAFYGGLLSPAGAHQLTTIRTKGVGVTCTAPPVVPGPVVAVGLFPLPGLTAPDGINYFAGPLASMSGTGPHAVVAGLEGFKVLDLVTRQVVLDRTIFGSDGANLGASLLGVLPFAQAASAGAPAGLYGFGAAAGSVQNWSAANGWGLTSQTLGAYFDVVTAGGGPVSNTVAALGPVRGLEFVEFDANAQAYAVQPARSVPTSAFPGTGQLVSLQMPYAGGGVLVLGRSSGPSISTSGKVFYKNLGDALPATTLTSWGNVDARRLRCVPVGPKQACVATLFEGQGRAFLFDPASPNATPSVIVLTAEAGTLGLALTVLPNGHVGVVMANFTANSLTVAELSTDLVTIHSLNTIAAPAGCTGTAHPALLTDSEGLKAVVTCNGTDNYWVVKPFS